MKRWTVFSSYIRSFPAGSISLELAILFVRRPGGERFTVSGLNRKRSRASDYHPLPPGKAQRDFGSSHRLDLPAPPADPVDTAHGQPVFAGQPTTAPRWRLTSGNVLEDAQDVNRQEEESCKSFSTQIRLDGKAEMDHGPRNHGLGEKLIR